MLWSGVRNRAPVTRPPVWPVWMLAAATVFFVGFRIGLNAHDSNVIDVGYSGEDRSEEHTSELQSHVNLVCRLLLEKKKKIIKTNQTISFQIITNLHKSNPNNNFIYHYISFYISHHTTNTH